MRNLISTLVLLAALMPLSVRAAEERGLPLVWEIVDEILVIQTVDTDHSRVVFIRHGRAFATRLHCDDMLFVSCGDRFQLIWQDYWTCERVVEAPRLGIYTLPAVEGHDGPWHCMLRNMRDLRAPP